MKRRQLIDDFKTNQKEFEDLNITGMRFYIFPEPEAIRLGYKGTAQVKYSVPSKDPLKNYDHLEARFRLQSIWIDEYGTNPSVCKAVCEIVQRPETDETRNALTFGKLVAYRKDGKTIARGDNRMSWFVNRDVTAVIYTVERDADFYRTQSPDNAEAWARGNYPRTPIFDSSIHAIRACVEVIESKLGYKMTGKELVNWMAVPSDLLREAGFIEIKDRFGVNDSMWLGNPNKLIINSSQEWSWPGGESGYYNSSSNKEAARVGKMFMDRLATFLT